MPMAPDGTRVREIAIRAPDPFPAAATHPRNLVPTNPSIWARRLTGVSILSMSPSRNRAYRSDWVCSALLAVLAIGALTGCGQQATGAGGRSGRGGTGGAPAPVIVSQVERQVVPLAIESIGTVEPIRTAAVRAQITGTLLEIAIQEGQDVAAGDLLFEIDPRPFENALRSALADEQRVKAQLDTARAQAERYRSLDAGGMVSQEQLQQVQDAARALEAQAAAAAAEVANARLQLGYCSIRAPISGRTGHLAVHEGDLVRANEAVPLVTINQLHPIYVTYGVPQQHLAALMRYRSAGSLKVSFATAPDEPPARDGELTFIDNTVDPSTGTIKLKATFPNDDQRLWPGQFATVTTTLAAPEVLTIPVSAVQTSQTGQHVFVVSPENKAELREVMIERTAGDLAVVTRGLEPGETVVSDGQLRVVPGGLVQIKPADFLTTPGAAAAAAKNAPAGPAKSGKGPGKQG